MYRKHNAAVRQGLSPRHIILFLLISPVIDLISAAQVKLHGKITDAAGEPNELATVHIAGTAIGTTSGLEGEYSLT